MRRAKVRRSVVLDIVRSWSLATLSLGAMAGAVGCGGDTGGRDAGADGGTTLAWYTTCGDPVCRGYTPPAGVARCTMEKAGDPCTPDGAKCDPMSACNALLVCAGSDPKTGPGGCPISHRAAKTEVQYVDDAARQGFADEIARTKLATYRYKVGGPRRLGFLIDDQPLSMSVDPERDMVDLYGYTSMAVAAIQQQAARIAALETELALLKQQLAKRPSRGGRSGGR